MQVEVISIGDELLIGQTINTNASWIGEQLLNIGIHLRWITTVGDRADHINLALQTAESRADVILLTGGLGPTHDDITKHVIADYFNSKLVMDEAVLESIKIRFQKRGIPMVKVNEQQARVPDKADVIANANGTAPALHLNRNNTDFYVMPGVPREMKPLMQNIILPKIKSRLGEKFMSE